MSLFILMIVMPVIVGYVIYRVINQDHESWQRECERMNDDMW